MLLQRYHGAGAAQMAVDSAAASTAVRSFCIYSPISARAWASSACKAILGRQEQRGGRAPPAPKARLKARLRNRDPPPGSKSHGTGPSYATPGESPKRRGAVFCTRRPWRHSTGLEGASGCAFQGMPRPPAAGLRAPEPPGGGLPFQVRRPKNKKTGYRPRLASSPSVPKRTATFLSVGIWGMPAPRRRSRG